MLPQPCKSQNNLSGVCVVMFGMADITREFGRLMIDAVDAYADMVYWLYGLDMPRVSSHKV